MISTNTSYSYNNLNYYYKNIVYIIKIQIFIRQKYKYNIHNTYKKITNKQKLVNKIFKPNIYGISKWRTREYLSKTKLKLSNNGNCRHGKFYNDSRFIWEKQTHKNKVVALRTNGFVTF